MSKKPALHPRQAVGHSFREVALDILGEIRATLQAPPRADAVTIHDLRKALKRWRALMRLLPLDGDQQRLRAEARDLARALGGSRDAQSALDALNDVLEDTKKDRLSARSIETITSRLEETRRSKERSQLNAKTRAQLSAWVASTEAEAARWPLDEVTFAEIAENLASDYGRARKRIPDNWSLATPEQIHELRQRVVEHRYQMELVEPSVAAIGRHLGRRGAAAAHPLGQISGPHLADPAGGAAPAAGAVAVAAFAAHRAKPGRACRGGGPDGGAHVRGIAQGIPQTPRGAVGRELHQDGDQVAALQGRRAQQRRSIRKRTAEWPIN